MSAYSVNVTTDLSVNNLIDASSSKIHNYGTFGKNVSIGSDTIYPTYALHVNGTVGVSGDLICTGDISHNGILDLSGGIILIGDLIHTGDHTHIGGSMNIEALAVSGSADISGSATIHGGATMGSATITNNATMGSATITNNATMGSATIGTMSVTGAAIFSNSVKGVKSLDTSGNAFATLDWVNDKTSTIGGGGGQWADLSNNIYNVNTGNVGIGKSNPQYKLDVSGTMNVDADAIIHGHTVGRGGNSQDNTSVAVGQGSLANATSSTYNTAIGFQTLYLLSSGIGNTAVGYNAAANVSSGTGNTFLGYAAGAASDTFSRSTAIGYNSSITSSDQIVLGKTADQFTVAPTVYIPGHVGIGKSNPTTSTTALDVSGTITATNFNATSDLRLKENINDLSNSLEKICAIRGVEYTWKGDDTKKLQSGVIAQEVNMIIPEAVNTSNPDTMTVNYNAIIGHLIEAIKTLKQEVDDLKGQRDS